MTCYNSELPIGPPGPTGPAGPQGPAGELLYKVYTALLTQSGENPPIVTELENTTDFVLTFTRASDGRYTSNTFLADSSKITITCSIGFYNVGTYLDGITLSSSISGAGPGNIYFELRTANNGVGLEDNLLTNAVLEIKIYP